MKFSTLKTLPIGTRVIFADSWDIYPICIVPAGTTGVIVDQNKDFTAILPDEANDGLDEWSGQIHVSQLSDDWPESPIALDDMEALKAEGASMLFWGSNGFEFWETGGGCTAYALQLDGDAFVLVTGEGGTEPPLLDGEKVLIGYYDDGSSFDGDEDWAYTFDDALKAVQALIEKHKTD